MIPNRLEQSLGKRPSQGKVKNVFYSPVSEWDVFTRGPGCRYIFLRMV